MGKQGKWVVGGGGGRGNGRKWGGMGKSEGKRGEMVPGEVRTNDLFITSPACWPLGHNPSLTYTASGIAYTRFAEFFSLEKSRSPWVSSMQ